MPLATASRWNSSKFVVIKHFGWESLNVQPSCCLDVEVYMLNCVFWRHIPLEIEFKSRVDMASDSNWYTAQRYHPWAVRQLKKFYQRSYIMILTHLSNTIKNCGRKFRFINTLNCPIWKIIPRHLRGWPLKISRYKKMLKGILSETHKIRKWWQHNECKQLERKTKPTHSTSFLQKFLTRISL